MAHRSSIGMMHARQDGVDQAGGNRHSTYVLQRRQAWEENDNQYQHNAQQYYNEGRQARNERDNRVRPDSKFTISEQDMDVDNSDDISRDTMSMKNTAELFQKLEDLPTLIQNAKQELRLLRQSTKASDETLKLKEEIEMLRTENQNLQARNIDRFSRREDEDKIKNLEQELREARENIDKYKNKGTEDVLKYREADEKIKDLEKTLAVNKNDLNKITTEYEYLEKKMSDLQMRYQTAKDEKVKMEKELSESKTRLSRLMGNKLGDNNPDIADLSDKNRPTKLAEKNAEIYDNEWTDAFEVLHTHYYPEEKTIAKLLQILQDIKTECDKISKLQEEKLKEAMKLNRSTDSLPDYVYKQLKDFRRFTAEESLPEVIEKCMNVMRLKDYANFLHEEGVLNFFKACVELCWFMNVQDPPLVFGDTPRKNGTFDGNTFRFYTVTGETFNYLVWPALFLTKGGAMLSKGVAQAVKEKISYSPKQRNPGRDDGGSGTNARVVNAESHQYFDRNTSSGTDTTAKQLSHGNSTFSSNRERRDTRNRNYKQSVVEVSHPPPDQNAFSHTVRERENHTVASRMSQNLSSSQRDVASKNSRKLEFIPKFPKTSDWSRFVRLISLHGLSSAETIRAMGENYNACRDYYIYLHGNNSSESNV